MKIGFFTSELSHRMGKKIGGLGNVALEMLQYLSKKHDTVYVFSASNQKGNKVIVQQEANITYHWFPDSMIGVNGKIYFNKYIRSFNNHIKSYLQKTYFSKDPNYFDIIHVHDWMTISIILSLNIIPHPKTRKILHMHSSEYGRSGNQVNYHDDASMYRHNLEMQGCHAADLVIAVAQVFKEELVGNFNVDYNKIHVVHNGMDYTSWLPLTLNNDYDSIRSTVGLSQTDQVILFCGRIVWQKNPRLILDAFKIIAGKLPNARLVFMGDGHMVSELEDEARKVGLWQTRIHFLGCVYGENKKKWFATAQCLVVSSFNEPFGLIFLEALICKTPVLYPSNISANKFLKHQVHGLRFEPNKTSLAQQIIYMLKHSSKARMMGEHGFEYVQKTFNVDVMGEKLFEEYMMINNISIEYEIPNEYFI